MTFTVASFLEEGSVALRRPHTDDMTEGDHGRLAGKVLQLHRHHRATTNPLRDGDGQQQDERTRESSSIRNHDRLRVS
jgi:hypothetical protein